MPFFADINGDGAADLCLLTGVNGGTTGSGDMEVHCALGPNFATRGDFVTPFTYGNTDTTMPFFADINGDGAADLCLLDGINGGMTGSGGMEVHCALGPNFATRGDFVTPFAYSSQETTWIADRGDTAPLAPSDAFAQSGDEMSTVSFSPPTYDGGIPITNYTVTASPGGMTASGTTSPIAVPGLVNGTSYTFTVKANNAFGPGPSSLPSDSVTVGVAPTFSAPSSTTFVEANPGTLTLSAAGNPTPAISETGTLPTGVTLIDNGDGTATLSGTSTQTGSFPITITASNGVSPDASQSLTINVVALEVTTRVLPGAIKKSSYSITLGAEGGASPYKWSLASGSSLPPGLTLSTNGTISGKPTKIGTFSFSVKVTSTKTLVFPKDKASSAVSLVVGKK